jgi:hypothetical protein
MPLYRKPRLHHITAYVGYNGNRALCGTFYAPEKEEPGLPICKTCHRIEMGGIR